MSVMECAWNVSFWTYRRQRLWLRLVLLRQKEIGQVVCQKDSVVIVVRVVKILDCLSSVQEWLLHQM
jgi:hypothetical protein